MIAIRTRYMGWTSTRPAYMAADANGHKVRLSLTNIPGDTTDEGMHRLAAMKLKDKMGWKGELLGGGTKDAYYWVFLPRGFVLAPAGVLTNAQHHLSAANLGKAANLIAQQLAALAHGAEPS